MPPAIAPDWDRIIVHYAEIGTKGGNRAHFERRLAQNLDGMLHGLLAEPFRRQPGRLAARLAPGADLEAALVRGARVPGTAWLAPAAVVPADLDAITKALVSVATGRPAEAKFRVSTRRSDKSFPHDSLAVNRHVGRAILEATGRRVSLTEPVDDYGVEIDRKQAILHWDRREGPGGLPTGSEGRLVALLSGGIDSPVAAWRMLVRGCRIHLVHFLNRSLSANRVLEKVNDLAAALALYHGPIDLTIVPFDMLQSEIVMACPASLRMLVYRRAMLRIADRIRREDRAYGFVTGDSVGQVASQTLENLRAVYQAVEHPIYAPLAGMSKLEITATARRIGAYEISIRPHEDCCSFMIAKHPETKAKLGAVLKAEEGVDFAAGIDAALAAREKRTVVPPFHAEAAAAPPAGVDVEAPDRDPRGS